MPKGTIQYDPRVTTDGVERYDRWWMFVLVHESAVAEFRKSLAGIPLASDGWPPHISAITGEKPPTEFRGRWGHRNGEIVEFQLGDEVKIYEAPDRRVYYVEAECPDVTDIRRHLGLVEEPKVPLHVTLGSTVKG